MSRFDFRTISSYAAAIAVTLWSTTMIFAATSIPTVAAAASSIA